MNLPYPDDLSFLLSDPEIMHLLGIPGPLQADVKVLPLGRFSRNEVYRLVDPQRTKSVIIKIVRKETDRFWEHHVRREHWLLRLLEHCAPELAPRPYAVAINREWGILSMEMCAGDNLADLLEHTATALARQSLLAEALGVLAILHRILLENREIFERVVSSIQLDEVTPVTLQARFHIALQRLFPSAKGDIEALWHSRGALTDRLFGSQVQVIHNSLVPLNILKEEKYVRFIDWETAAVAAPEWDLADLLFNPFTALSPDAALDLIAHSYRGLWDEQRTLVAGLLRSLDYAASATQQAATADSDYVVRLKRRAVCYLNYAQELCLRCGWAALSDFLTRKIAHKPQSGGSRPRSLT